MSLVRLDTVYFPNSNFAKINYKKYLLPNCIMPCSSLVVNSKQYMKQRINSMSYQMHILTVIFFRNLKFFKFSGISGTRVRVQILYPYPIGYGYGPSYLGSGTGMDFETRPRPVRHFNFPSVYYIIPFLQIILKIGRQRRSSVHF